MADGSLGDLLVRIGGNVEGLRLAASQGAQALQSMNVSATGAAGGMIAAFAGIAGAVYLVGKAIDATVVSVVNKMVDLGKTSAQIGIPVKELQGLSFAARQAGVSSDELAQGIRLFARNAGEIRSAIEPADEFVRALNAIGISFGQLKALSPTELILEIGDRFSRMEDGVQKTRLAMQMFGRTGADMIPFLNQGKEAIQGYMEKLNATGNVLDKNATMNATKFMVAIQSIGNSFENIVKRLVGDFLPVMENLATTFNGAVKNSENLKLATEGLRVVFLGLINVGTIVVQVFKGILETIGGITGVIKNVIAGDWTAALESFRKAWAALPNAVYQSGVQIADQWRQSGILAGGWAATVTKHTENVAKAIKVTEETAAQAAMRHAEARRRLISELASTNGPTVFAVEAISKAFAQGKISLDEYNAAMDKAIGFHRIGELNTLDAVMSKTYTTAAAKIRALETAVRGGTIGFYEFGKMVEQVERDNQQNMMDTASVAASTLTTVFKNNKSAAIGSAIINTAVGITRAFRDVPWPFNWAQAALIGATGAAQVQQISSASENGGGAAAPSAAASSSASSAPTTAGPDPAILRVQGMDPKALFSGDYVAGLAKALTKYAEDGGKVVYGK